MFSNSRWEAGASRADAEARRRRGARPARPEVQSLESRSVPSHVAFAPSTFAALQSARRVVQVAPSAYRPPLARPTFATSFDTFAPRRFGLPAAYIHGFTGPTSIPTVPTTNTQYGITWLAGPPRLGASPAPIRSTSTSATTTAGATTAATATTGLIGPSPIFSGIGGSFTGGAFTTGGAPVSAFTTTAGVGTGVGGFTTTPGLGGQGAGGSIGTGGINGGLGITPGAGGSASASFATSPGLGAGAALGGGGAAGVPGVYSGSTVGILPILTGGGASAGGAVGLPAFLSGGGAAAGGAVGLAAPTVSGTIPAFSIG